MKELTLSVEDFKDSKSLEDLLTRVYLDEEEYRLFFHFENLKTVNKQFDKIIADFGLSSKNIYYHVWDCEYDD